MVRHTIQTGKKDPRMSTEGARLHPHASRHGPNNKTAHIPGFIFAYLIMDLDHPVFAWQPAACEGDCRLRIPGRRLAERARSAPTLPTVWPAPVAARQSPHR